MIERLPNDVDLADWAKILLVKDKVNELVNELNRHREWQDDCFDKLLELEQRVKTPETPPEKETCMPVYDAILVRDEAIADYKKKTLESLRSEIYSSPNTDFKEGINQGILRAIDIVEDTE